MSLQKISGSGLGGIYVTGDEWGFQTAEKVRQSINSLAARKGASATLLMPRVAPADFWYGVTNAVAFNHPLYWDVLIDWTEMASGWTVVARLEVIAEDATGSVTASIRNVTDSASYAGTAIVATSYTEDVITIPVPAVLALKRYRLQLTEADIAKGGNAVGVIEVYG